jgi:hypothetical protein
VVSQTGFCVAYIIFIHDTLPNVIPAVSPWMVMAVIVPVQVRSQLLLLSCCGQGIPAAEPSVLEACRFLILVSIVPAMNMLDLSHLRSPWPYCGSTILVSASVAELYCGVPTELSCTSIWAKNRHGAGLKRVPPAGGPCNVARLVSIGTLLSLGRLCACHWHDRGAQGRCRPFQRCA